jgi:hypothetical protein
MKSLASILLIAMMWLTSCNKCPVPQNSGNNSLENWSITYPALLRPLSERPPGVISIHPECSPASVASKEFNCGNGKNCNLTFPVSAPSSGVSDESISVIFESNSLPSPRVISFHHQPGSNGNPVNITFPFCGTIKVTVHGNEGVKPGFQDSFSVGPFYYECMDCAIKERGQRGN